MKKHRDKTGKVLRVGDAIHVVGGVNQGRHAVVDGFSELMVRLTWTSPREWKGKKGRVTPGKCVIQPPPSPSAAARAFIGGHSWM